LSVNIARICGPALAAALLATSGAAVCFLVNGLSYLPVLVVLLGIRVPRTDRPQGSLLTGLRDGFGFVRRNRDMRDGLLTLAAYAVLTMNLATLLPTLVDRELRSGATVLGLLFAAQGVGALAASLYAGRLWPSGSNTAMRLAPALVVSAGLTALALLREPRLALVLMLAIGFGQSRLIISTQRLLQLQTPEQLRGRVMSLFGQVMLGGLPLGALLAGVLARSLGVSAAIALGAAAAAVVAVLIACAARLRRTAAGAGHNPLNGEPGRVHRPAGAIVRAP
jgi:predicted MFS family arabinose efflux permease